MKAFLFLLVISGCTYIGNVKVAEPRTVEITWDRISAANCGVPFADGCAYVSKDRTKCRIVMLEDSPDYIVAHEFRHCFGFVHSEAQK